MKRLSLPVSSWVKSGYRAEAVFSGVVRASDAGDDAVEVFVDDVSADFFGFEAGVDAGVVFEAVGEDFFGVLEEGFFGFLVASLLLDVAFEVLLDLGVALVEDLGFSAEQVDQLVEAQRAEEDVDEVFLFLGLLVVHVELHISESRFHDVASRRGDREGGGDGARVG